MKVKSWLWVLLVLCLSVSWSQAGGEDEVTLPPGAGPGNRLLRSGATPDDQDAEDRREQYPYVASPIRKFDKEDETIYEEHSGLEFPRPDSSTSDTLNDVNSIESSQFSKESPSPLDEIEAEESQVYRNTSLTSPPVELLPGVQLVTLSSHRPRSFSSFFDNHALRISLPAVADAASNLVSTARFAFGKNSFLTGFGLGFMAFGLKKLLLPVFIGMQIVKSVLVAMFLPTVLSHVGKLVGKGVSTVASGSSAGQQQHDVGDFEFKDTTDLDQDGAGSDGTAMWTIPSQSHATLAALNPPFAAQPTKDFGERYTPVNPKLPALPTKHHGSFYTKDPHQDYKIFHKIPNSSHLLAHYDPFYSPLLSRLDSVFQQLGTTAELCRQRLVCDMYSNPAKFAPYSNLVSAQLSRELNELRKPSSDNPEILRFFRYMKAAKDGQDGMSCQIVYSGCVAPTAPTQGSPMIETFNQINKLVHARNLKH